MHAEQTSGVPFKVVTATKTAVSSDSMQSFSINITAHSNNLYFTWSQMVKKMLNLHIFITQKIL